MIVENSGRKPFFRVEIPPGADPPYCTSGGTYKTREDGRVRALIPADLLQILLRREAAAFQQRFDKVAEKVLVDVGALAQSVAAANKSIGRSVKDMADTLGWTDMKVDDTASEISSALSVAKQTAVIAKDIEARVISLVGHAGAPDPVKAAARAKLVAEFEAKFKEDPALLEKLKTPTELKISGARVNLFTSQEIADIILDAARTAA